MLFEIENPEFPAYLKKLGDVSGIPIKDWDSLRAALSQRMDAFAEAGCVISDHSLEEQIFVEDVWDSEAESAVKKAINGEELFQIDIWRFKTKLLSWLGGEYHKRDWVMQFHIAAQRNNNSRMQRLVGTDIGFDCMSDGNFSLVLAKILDDMEQRDALPRTILYGINPCSDDMLAVLAGCFAGRGIRGRIQWGCPWWFNDNKTGIQKYLTTLANHGLVSTSIGMLTDSRSFISYPRHEYFRRILANQLGEWVENGEFPRDMNRLHKIAGDISYFNVKDYFR
jgi:glucuronate isomerase